MSKPRRWNLVFVRILVLWTTAAHVPLAWLVWTLAPTAVWGLSLAGLVVVLGTLLLRPIILNSLPDFPRPGWRVQFIEKPYFAHWFASNVAWIGLLAAFAIPAFAPSRTHIVAGAYCLGLALGLYGAFVRSQRFRVRHVNIELDRLPPEWNGVTIALLSDLHIGAFTPPSLIENWVTATHSLRPDLIAITGDVVSSGTMFHATIAQTLKRLVANEAVLFVPGNHDYFGDGEPLFSWLQEGGIHVLRNQRLTLRRGDSSLTIAGVDDRWTQRTDLSKALGPEPHDTTILLAHDPLIFAEAVNRGVPLTLAGHTHGGQFALPFAARTFNLSRLSNPFSLGVYREARSTIVVSAGLGTTGIPIRLGVAPELILIRLLTADGVKTLHFPLSKI